MIIHKIDRTILAGKIYDISYPLLTDVRTGHPKDRKALFQQG